MKTVSLKAGAVADKHWRDSWTVSTLLCLILMQHSSRKTIILRNLKPEVNLVHLKFLSLLTVTLEVLGSLINMLHFFVYLTRSGLQPIPIHEGYGFFCVWQHVLAELKGLKYLQLIGAVQALKQLHFIFRWSVLGLGERHLYWNVCFNDLAFIWGITLHFNNW